MSQILLFYLGEGGWQNESDCNASQDAHTFYRIYDKERYSLPPEGDRTVLVDYGDPEGVKNAISAISPISQIFIMVKPGDELEAADEMKRILDKALIVLSGVTLPLMLQRGGKVWLVYAQGRNRENRAADLGAGLKILVQVYAMEMSRKGVTANFVAAEPDEDRLEAIIRWGESRLPFNLTSQQIIL